MKKGIQLKNHTGAKPVVETSLLTKSCVNIMNALIWSKRFTNAKSVIKLSPDPIISSGTRSNIWEIKGSRAASATKDLLRNYSLLNI